MAAKKIIAVIGATGVQGGSVAKIFLNDPVLSKEWQVRGITRNTSSDKAKALAEQGAEVVAADLTKLDTLVKAFQGASVIYAMTNFWESTDKSLEIQQGKNMVDAAEKTEGLDLFIYSSLLGTEKASHGKYKHVDHFDGKAEIEEYARAKPNLPSAFFLAGFYMSNLSQNMIRPVPPHNKYGFVAPMPGSAPAPYFDAEADTGKFVKGMVRNQKAVLGKRILGTSGYRAIEDALTVFQKTYPQAGEGSSYAQLPGDAYQGILQGPGQMPEKIAVEMREMMEFIGEFGYYGGASLEESLALVEDKLTSLEDYVRKAPEWQELK